MPCTYKANVDENVIVKRYTGRITSRCILNLLDSMELDPDYVEGMYELDDMREVTELAIPPEEIRQFAELIKGYGVRARGLSHKAIVAHTSDVKKAFYMFKSFVSDSGLQVGIFESLDEALAFLNVCPTTDRSKLLPVQSLVH